MFSNVKRSLKLLVSHKGRFDLGIKWQLAVSFPFSGITEQHTLDCTCALFFPVRVNDLQQDSAAVYKKT